MSLSASPPDADGRAQGPRLDFMADDRPLPDEVAEQVIDFQRQSECLAEALKGLSARELRIVCDRRLKEEASTLESLGADLGISKERVRQIENRAIEKLRRVMVGG
jgi:RNA polymerase sigma-32 factor